MDLLASEIILRLVLALADKCETLDEFRAEVKKLLQK